jgi:uncharacterized protein
MTPARACYPGIAPIEAYGKGGFRFAGMSHRGSILCLPSGVYAWEPSIPPDVASLGPALAEKDSIGFLVVGTGACQLLPSPGVRRAFAEAGVALEFMDTGAACRTYNVLLAEGRPAGAALIAAD